MVNYNRPSPYRDLFARLARRGWIPSFFVVLAMLLAPMSSAFAVHDTGLFQLDGNAQTSLQSTPPGNDDWDKVCPATVPPSQPLASAVHCLGGVSTATSVFVPDAFGSGSDDIFKGGTDDADINTWQWKQAKPSPDKADIEHAFAAQYTGTAAPYAGHKLLFFGGDRLSNSGDTNIGLWFFHNQVGEIGSDGKVGTACTAPSGCPFDQLHTVGNISLGGATPGDIFILSAFTSGGAEPSIKVFEWVGPGNATKNYLGSNGCFTSACTLQPLAIPPTPGFTDNRCDAATVSGDVACAIVNSAAIAAPWTFLDKATGSTTQIGTSEFYEGGLDLTGLGLGQACFSTTLLNTRSSQSGTSVLQDFALGRLGSCDSGMVTTPKDGSGGAIGSGGLSIGTGSVSVKDSAQLTINGVSSWTGTLKFFLCGPIATGTCDGTTNVGTQIGSTQNVSQATTEPILSSAAAVTSVGRYCWRGVFTSTTTGVPSSTDSSATECFTVTPVTPSISTSQDAGPLPLGSTIHDTATLSGTANQPGSPVINPTVAGSAAGGTIIFTVYGPQADPNNPVCTGTAVFTSGPFAVSGNGTYGPAGFTPTAAGQYNWIATYSGNSPNTVGIASLCADEASVISNPSTTLNKSAAVSASVSYTYAESNDGSVALTPPTPAAKSSLVTDPNCSPIVFDSGDTNNNNVLDLGETWNFHCDKTLLTSATATTTVGGSNTATGHGTFVLGLNTSDVTACSNPNSPPANTFCDQDEQDTNSVSLALTINQGK